MIASLADLKVVVNDHEIALPWFEADIYLCGPGDFCAELKRDFIAHGANPDHIFLEMFAAASAEAAGIERAEVRFSRSGLTCEWTADDDLTLLDLAEQAGAEVDSECRAGSCLTCKTRVMAGATTADMEDGSALLCIGRPKTAELVLDL